MLSVRHLLIENYDSEPAPILKEPTDVLIACSNMWISALTELRAYRHAYFPLTSASPNAIAPSDMLLIKMLRDGNFIGHSEDIKLALKRRKLFKITIDTYAEPAAVSSPQSRPSTAVLDDKHDDAPVAKRQKQSTLAAYGFVPIAKMS